MRILLSCNAMGRLTSAGWLGSDVFICPQAAATHMAIASVTFLELSIIFAINNQRQMIWGQTRTFDPSDPVGS